MALVKSRRLGGARRFRPQGSKRGPLFTAAMMVGALALVASACSKSTTSTSSSSAAPAGTSASIQPGIGTKVQGGTVTFAEAPNASPNYIFPLAPGSKFSTVNIPQFQQLMYRPLYWFGNNYTASINYDYSLAKAPVWSDDLKTVTMTMNDYKWSNGETVTARDTIFFMNLLSATKDKFGAYTPGYFPDNVASYKAPDDKTVVMTLTAPANPTWFLYNELSQITPFPLAWDVTAAGQTGPTTDNGSLPDSTPAGAKAVFAFLDNLARDTSSYTTSPIWKVVDGPFTLSDFTNTGQATFVPNPSYSGSPKPTIDKFVELPFTSEPAELNVAKTGANNLTIGYIAAAAVPQESSVLSKGFYAYSLYTFSVNYFVLNLHNPTLGPAFSQLYFRQAFQRLVNQKGWVKAYSNGTAIAETGVIPTDPPNSFLSPAGKTFPYDFDVSKASALLSSHGWSVKPNGITTCTNPGSGPDQCGAGVAQGLPLTFNLDYLAGPVEADQEMKELKSEAAKVGITLNLTTHPFHDVVGAAVICKPTDPSCTWTAENWGGGWVYSPDYYPSGELLFSTGALSDYSNYSDPKADQLIQATTVGPDSQSQSTLNAYQDYMQQQLPVVLQPNNAGNPVPGGLTIVSQHMGGFSANAFTALTPETYYLTK